nr:Sulfatase [uncultured organism]
MIGKTVRRVGLGVAAIALTAGLVTMTPAIAKQASMQASRLKAGEQVQRPMNVLFIIADDLAPRLGSYGFPVKTPNIDRLAAQSVSFDRAYAQFPWCGPSRASFLTGTRPNTTRVIDLTTPFRTALPDIMTMPQYFRANGYFSGRVGKIFHQGVPNDIGTGGPDDSVSWDAVVNPRGRDRDAEDGRLKVLTPGIPYGSAMAYLDDEGDDAEQTDGKVATAAIEMIRANKNKPFFIGVGFYRPHVPEVAPKKYFDLYPLDKIQPTRQSAADLSRLLPASKAWTPDNFGMTPDEQRQMIRAYYAATSFMDAQVGRVIDALQEMGLADDTIVVFTSDHGFMLGEHGQWMKNILWEESDRVPLVIRVPGSRTCGKRSPRTVELLDLYPTLTELAGLPKYGRNEGTSLSPLLRNPVDRNWTKPALSQIRGGRSVRTERWRYTEWEAGKLGRELYDHSKDPLEQHNLADDQRFAATTAQLRALLPGGPVEKRPAAVRYDAVRDCAYFPQPKSGTSGAGASAGGEGGGGLNRCETLDP